jgi:hypothetical protein
MRFHFNVRSDEDFDEDREGIDLPSLAASTAEAEKASREMVAELVLRRGRIDHMRFEITDDQGVVVATLAFKDVIRLG